MDRPEIFNTDQVSQFTSHSFVNRLQAHEVKISMDGKGRAMDNIFVERMWRSLKYDNAYPHRHETPVGLYHGLNDIIDGTIRKGRMHGLTIERLMLCSAWDKKSRKKVPEMAS